VLAMADGFAQSTGRPAVVNVHTGAGTGNAMGSLVAAYKGNTPLIVTAGQQTREMVLCEPYLTNEDENVLPQPWVKWAYQPAGAEDVPAAFMRAYTIALQPPAGPVFLSIPLDDWNKPALGPAAVRTTSHGSPPTPSGQPRVAPDTERLASGGIGWGVPAAVGVALGDRARGVKRTVLATIDDGSFQYSVQAIWTAAQHRLPVVFVVMRNGEYSILKSFALLEKTPGVPGLDLPGLDIASIAAGFGCRAVNVDSTDQLAHEFTTALHADGPTVIVVPTQPQQAHLG